MYFARQILSAAAVPMEKRNVCAEACRGMAALKE